METLNELIEKLLELQKQGKGEYIVIDGYVGEYIEIKCKDEEKLIIVL